VDLYDQRQEYRKRTANQTCSAEEDAEPNALVSHLLGQTEVLEENARRALAAFADAYRVGRWAQSLTGIGPHRRLRFRPASRALDRALGPLGRGPAC
jgi:hypothetical protein